MAKRNSRNTDILKDTKGITSHKIYSILVKCVNEEREDLAEDVLKADYLLNYTSNCIKAKDYREAKETIAMAKNRINKVKDGGFDVKYLMYLYEGIKNKIK